MTNTETAGKKDFFSELLETSLPDSTFSLPPLGESDVVLGTMSPSLQRMYQMRYNLAVELDRKIRETKKKGEAHRAMHKVSADPILDHDCDCFWAEMDELEVEIEKLYVRNRFLDSIFWSVICLDFPQLVGREDAGIRERFQVVHTNSRRKASVRNAELITVDELLSIIGKVGPDMSRKASVQGEGVDFANTVFVSE